MSPTAALTSLGANERDPFVPPTRTTWTVTIPEAAGAAAEEATDD